MSELFLWEAILRLVSWNEASILWMEHRSLCLSGPTAGDESRLVLPAELSNRSQKWTLEKLILSANKRDEKMLAAVVQRWRSRRESQHEEPDCANGAFYLRPKLIEMEKDKLLTSQQHQRTMHINTASSNKEVDCSFLCVSSFRKWTTVFVHRDCRCQ